MISRCPQCNRPMEGSPLACGEHGVPIYEDEGEDGVHEDGCDCDRCMCYKQDEAAANFERESPSVRGTPYDPVD